MGVGCYYYFILNFNSDFCRTETMIAYWRKIIIRSAWVWCVVAAILRIHRILRIFNGDIGNFSIFTLQSFLIFYAFLILRYNYPSMLYFLIFSEYLTNYFAQNDLMLSDLFLLFDKLQLFKKFKSHQKFPIKRIVIVSIILYWKLER